jgi:ABC-type methionine transport system ATPase subunit
MAKKSAPSPKPASPASPASPTSARQSRRLWLMYPAKLIQEPIIWQLAQKFPVVTNLRQVSVTDEIGIVCLELNGPRKDIDASIAWLEKLGVKVEPVEINVVES